MSVLRVALCGNPNVGKSTVFNALTGLRATHGKLGRQNGGYRTRPGTGKHCGLDAHGPARRVFAAERLAGRNGCKRLPDL